MNHRLLHQARQMHLARQLHQRRMSYFYLAPTEEDYASARLLANQLSLRLPPAARDRPDDPYDDDPDDYF